MTEQHTNTAAQPTTPLSSQHWTAKDRRWVFAHIGTGIGAGLLYLPISAGAGGLWPLLVVALIAVPITWLTHRGLTRFCLSSGQQNQDITQVVKEHFGRGVGRWIMAVCFLSMFPVLLLYTIGITNVSTSFLVNQLGFAEPSWTLSVVVLVAGMITLFSSKEQSALRFMTLLVFPLTLVLLGIAFYLIPQWKLDFLQQSTTFGQCLNAFFSAIPIIVFTIYHAPVCPTFARSYRLEQDDIHRCIKKTDRIHLVSTLMLLTITLFFVFSCAMAMTPEQLLQAKQANLPALSVLANQPGNRFFSSIAPIIAFVSILTSFFGFFIGSLEVLNGLLRQGYRAFKPDHQVSDRQIRWVSLGCIALCCTVAGIGNWSVLALMEMLVAPMMAVLLFFVPTIAIYKVDMLKRYQQPIVDWFILIMGFIIIAGFLLTQVI